jgi:hypothetical protein
MKPLHLILSVIALLSACKCPEIATTSTHSTDTVTVIKDTTIMLPGQVVRDTINLSSFCDSVVKGFAVKRSARHVIISVDTTGNATVDCHTDSLKAVIKWQEQVIKDTKNTTTISYVERSSTFDKACRWVAAALLILLFLVYKFK